MLKKLFGRGGKKKKQGPPEYKLNKHFVFIEAPIEIVAPEVILWGEASWWPKECPVKFTRKTEGEVRVGTQYRQRITKPLAPSWLVEVTKLDPQREIQRSFLRGMFDGYETVCMEWRVNGTRVDYELHYRLRGLQNKFLWPFLYEKLHDKNIKMILNALKDYATKVSKEQEDKRIDEA